MAGTAKGTNLDNKTDHPDAPPYDSGLTTYIFSADYNDIAATANYVFNNFNTHSGSASAHHPKYTDAEAVSAVEAETDLIMSGDLTVGVNLRFDPWDDADASQILTYYDATSAEQRMYLRNASDTANIPFKLKLLSDGSSYKEVITEDTVKIDTIQMLPVLGRSGGGSHTPSWYINGTSYEAAGALFQNSGGGGTVGDEFNWMVHIPPNWDDSKSYKITVYHVSWSTTSDRGGYDVYASAYALGETRTSHNLFNNTGQNLTGGSSGYEIVSNSYGSSEDINAGDIVHFEMRISSSGNGLPAAWVVAFPVIEPV